MNGWKRTALALSAMLVVSLPLMAQGPPKGGPPGPPRVGPPGGPSGPGGPGGERGRPGGQGQGRRGGGGMAMMPVSALATIVTLKPAQKVKITAIQNKLKADMKAANGDRAKMGPLFTAVNNDLKAVLTPQQQKTVEAKLPVVMLLNRSRAVPAAVLADVKLTAPQMGKITTLATAEQAKMEAVPREERRTKGQEIMAGFKTQVDALLTPAQKAIIAKYHPPTGTGMPGRPSAAARPL